MIAAFLVGYGLSWQKSISSPKKVEGPIKIGFSSALTGPVQMPGNWALQGAELAVSDLNNAGGINSRQIELIVEDDQCSATEASKTANKLINIDKVDKMFIFCAAAAPGTITITKNKAIVIYPSVGIIAEPNYFTVYPSVELEMAKLANYIINEKGIKEIAEFYQADAAGEAMKINFVKAFQAFGGEVSIVESSSNFENKDFKTALLKVKEKNIKAIMLTGAPANFIKGVEQATELGLEAQFFSNTLGVENATVVKTLGELAEGIEFSAPYDTEESKKTGTFYDAYKAKYNSEPSVWSAFAYDAITILAKLTEKCNDDLNCMQKEIIKIKNFPGASGQFSFNQDGSTDRNIYIKRIEDGKFKVVKVFEE